MSGDARAAPGDGMSRRRRAACASEDLEMLFPAGTSGPALTQVACGEGWLRPVPRAAGVPAVRGRHRPGYGTWGALTGDERRGLRYPGQLSGPPGGTSETLASTSTGATQPPEANQSQNRRRPKHGCASASHTGCGEPPCPRRSMPPPPQRTPRSSLVPSANTATMRLRPSAGSPGIRGGRPPPWVSGDQFGIGADDAQLRSAAG